MPTADKVAVTEFVRHKLEELLKKSSEVEVGKLVGVSGPAIHLIKVGKNGVGHSAEAGFARILAGGSVDKLRKEARDWWMKQPQASERKIELDARYPNFDIAAAYWLGNGGSKEAVEKARASLFGPDLTPEDWHARIRVADLEIRAGRAGPKGTPLTREDEAAMKPGPHRLKKKD